ncbi:MAG: AbrB/MazE/SpoVT family DNA-binding domain-containing protein [Sphingomonadaceae bacterium]|nr:AbrB/MazE/SpoVT family DNA-binding domain-containing protein [Sphingomonadaceae bacterium]
MNAETKVSAKGQVVIPKAVRDELAWPEGTRLRVERVGGAVTLRPIEARRGTLTVEEFVARRPKYEGPPLSLEEMDALTAREMRRRFAGEYKIKR